MSTAFNGKFKASPENAKHRFHSCNFLPQGQEFRPELSFFQHMSPVEAHGRKGTNFFTTMT